LGKKGARRIAVAPDGTPWIITESKDIYRATRSGWKRVIGKATGIMIGADGSIFVLGPVRTKTGYKIYKIEKSKKVWKAVQGRAMRLAVDFKGVPWVVSSTKMIFQQTT